MLLRCAFVICKHTYLPGPQVDLTSSSTCTFPFESLKQLRTLCVSPSGALLLAVDENGRALLINRQRHALLHHFSFKSPVAAAKFSPNGQYIAVAVGRLLQVCDRLWLCCCHCSQEVPLKVLWSGALCLRLQT